MQEILSYDLVNIVYVKFNIVNIVDTANFHTNNCQTKIL